MNNRRPQLFIYIVSLAIILLVLGFVSAINISSLEKSYTDSLVTSYTIAGSEPVRKIEYAVKYGKPLTNFYGMSDILNETKQDFPEIADIQIILPDGTVTYSLLADQAVTRAPDSVVNLAFSRPAGSDAAGAAVTGLSMIEGASRHILLALSDNQGAQIGALDVILDNYSLQKKIGTYFWQSLRNLLLVAAGSILLILLVLRFAPLMTADRQINIRLLITALIVISALGQLALGLTHYNQFKQFYLETSRNNTAKVVKVVQRDINLVIEKGVPMTELYGIENWLDTIVKSVPEIESLYVTSMRGEVYYKTKNLILMQEELIDPMYNYSLPLSRDTQARKGLVNLVLSRQYMQSRLLDIALDALTILVTSLLLLTEVVLALALFLKLRQHRAAGSRQPRLPAAGTPERVTLPQEPLDPVTQLRLIRPIAFIFFMAFSMTVAFIPIVMRQLIGSQPGVSAGVWLSLPSSLEAVGNIAATLVAGYILAHQSWRLPFTYGLLIVGVGSLLSALAWSGSLFILARLVTGIGYGLSWMAMRGYVSLADSPAAQTSGFSSLNSGIMSGSICGIAMGSVIAGRAGFSFLFYLTALIMLGAAAFSFLARPKSTGKRVRRQPGSTLTAPAATASLAGPAGSAASPEQSGGDGKLAPPPARASVFDWAVIRELLFHHQTSRYLMMVILPATLCAVFLNYYFPAVGTQLGISPANIGRAFLLNGLFVIFLGPRFGHLPDNADVIQRRVIVANLIYAIALLVFGFWVNSWTAFFAVMLLGFGDSLGLAAQSSYYLNLDASRKAGGSMAMAGFSVFYKIGAIVGPLIFGVMMAGGAGYGAILVGLVSLLLLLAFAFSQRRKRPAQADRS